MCADLVCGRRQTMARWVCEGRERDIRAHLEDSAHPISLRKSVSRHVTSSLLFNPCADSGLEEVSYLILIQLTSDRVRSSDAEMGKADNQEE